MNYIEWALQRGAELWRAREEALKKRLSLMPEGTAQKKAAEAQLSEEEAAAQDAEMSGLNEKAGLRVECEVLIGVSARERKEREQERKR